MQMKRVSDSEIERELVHLEVSHFIPSALMLEYRSGRLAKELHDKINEFLAEDLRELQEWIGSIMGNKLTEISPFSEQEIKAWLEYEYNASKLSAQRRIELDQCIKASLYSHFRDDCNIITPKIKSLGDGIFIKRFEAYSYYYPASVAIRFRNYVLTYKEINERANRVAHQLIKNKIKKGDLIGTFLNRTPDWIVSILGIWKAGGAFIALDPTIPAGTFKVRAGYVERFNHLINEVGLKYVITDKLLSTRISNLPLIYIEDIRIDNSINPQVPILAENLAYVIYTSGSTGKPKGVQILHKGLTACLEAHRECVDLSEKSVMAQYATPGFDAWIAEMLILGIGGTLAIIPDEIRLDSDGLEKYCLTQNINIVILTPQLLRKLTPRSFPTWKALFIVGEKFGWEFANQWISSTLQVVNGYGLTETTICTNLENLNALKDDNRAFSYRENETLKPFIPIGRPIVGTNIQLFNSRHDVFQRYELTREGEEGEVFISGISLTPGYYGEAKQVNDGRFTTIDDLRYYMTGDKAVCCGSNRFVLIGRYNRVLKFDGKRIDLDGLENILLSHSGIASEGVACLADEKMDQCSILIIFLQPKDLKNPPSFESIKEYLQINDIRTAGIPLELYYKNYGFEHDKTANGKKDYKKLTDEYRQRRKATEEKYDQRIAIIEKNTCEIQNKILKLWSDVLPKNSKIMRDTNFFESGGSSVSLMLLLDRFRKEFNIQRGLLTPYLLYESPTVEFQAILLRNLQEPMRPIVLRAINNEPEFVIYCMPSILGKAEWDYEKMAEGLGSSVELIAFESRDAERMIHSMEGIAIDYVSSILMVHQKKHPHDPIFVLGWSSGGTIALEVANQLRRLKITAYCYVIDTFSPFIYQQLTPDTIAQELVILSKFIAKKCNLKEFNVDIENIKKQPTIIGKIEFVFSALLNSNPAEEICRIIQVARVIRLCEQVYIPSELPNFSLFTAQVQALEEIVTLNESLNWPIEGISLVHVIKNCNHFTILLDPVFQKKLLEQIISDARSRNSEKKSSLENLAQLKNQGYDKKITLNFTQEVEELAKSTEGKEFLRHVYRGDLDQVQLYLDRKRELALINVTIKDLSGRTFNRITALQYAFWAIDLEMCSLLLRFLPREKAYEQLSEFINDQDNIKPHGKHFSLLNYLQVLGIYLSHYEQWMANYNKGGRELMADYWCKTVGPTEKEFPAWMIMLMSEEGKGVAWIKKDLSLGFKRDQKLLDSWFIFRKDKVVLYLFDANMSHLDSISGFSWFRGKEVRLGIKALEFDSTYFGNDGIIHDREFCHIVETQRIEAIKRLYDELSAHTELEPLHSKQSTKKLITARAREVKGRVLPKQVRQFFNHLIKGNIQGVMNLLEKNKLLALFPSDIGDLSDRSFRQLTALQYSICALDVEMWTLILNYLPQEDAKNQIMAFLQEDQKTLKEHFAYYVLKKYLEALEKYLKNYESWKPEERAIFWCLDVGRAQREFYPWMIYVMTEQGEDVAWTKKDENMGFVRDPDEWFMRYWWVNGEENHLKLGAKPLNPGTEQIRYKLQDAGFAWSRCSQETVQLETGFHVSIYVKTDQGILDWHDYEIGSKLLAARMIALIKLCTKFDCLDYLLSILDGSVPELKQQNSCIREQDEPSTADRVNTPIISQVQNQSFWKDRTSINTHNLRVSQSTEEDLETTQDNKQTSKKNALSFK